RAPAPPGWRAGRTGAGTRLTKMPGELLPVDPLVAAADGESDPASRRLATLAMSCSAHPRAVFETLRIAADAQHAGSDVALLRLGELADPFVLALMQELQAAAGRRELGGAAVDKTQRRLAGLQLADVPQTAMTWVERAAWLRATGDPRAARAATVLGQALRDRLPDGQLRDALAPLAKGPLRAQFRGDEREKMEQGMKSFVGELRVLWRGRYRRCSVSSRSGVFSLPSTRLVPSLAQLEPSSLSSDAEIASFTPARGNGIRNVPSA